MTQKLKDCPEGMAMPKDLKIEELINTKIGRDFIL